MAKHRFLTDLKNALKRLPAEERDDILRDFEEHFALAQKDGRSVEEIAEELGSPQQIARELLATYHLEQAQAAATPANVLRALLAVLSLSFWNFAIVLGPFLGLVGMLLGAWVTAKDIRVRGTGWSLHGKLETAVEGDTLVVRVVRTRALDLFGGSFDLALALPQKAYESLRVDLKNGSFSAEQLELNRMRVATRNGDIDLRRVSGAIVGETANGTITVTVGILDHPMRLASINGDIELQAEQAGTSTAFDVRTRNGTITVLGEPSRNGNIRIMTKGEGVPR